MRQKNSSMTPESYLIRWCPGTDTAVAFASELIFIGVYSSNFYIGPSYHFARFLIFVIGGSLFVNVLFPTYYILRVRGEDLGDLGITTEHWAAALGLSVLLALFYLPRLVPLAAEYPFHQVLRNLVYNAIILWEPFFLFGWLQLRFERAFGVLPAILFTGICFGSYHAPALGFAYASNIMVAGVLLGTVFRLTRNLLSMIPLTWMVASSVGTLAGQMLFDWTTVLTYVVVLGIQIVAIAWLATRPRSRHEERSAE